MTTILEQTEQQLGAATDSANALQETRKRQIQSEIGHEAYAAAKKALPVMERYIQGTVIPWRENIERIAQAGARLAPPRQLGLTVFMALRELAER